MWARKFHRKLHEHLGELLEGENTIMCELSLQICQVHIYWLAAFSVTKSSSWVRFVSEDKDTQSPVLVLHGFIIENENTGTFVPHEKKKTN